MDTLTFELGRIMPNEPAVSLTLRTERLEELTALCGGEVNGDNALLIKLELKRLYRQLERLPLPKGRAWKAYAIALEELVTEAQLLKEHPAMGRVVKQAGGFDTLKGQAAAVEALLNCQGVLRQLMALCCHLKAPGKAAQERREWLRSGPKEAPKGHALKDWFRWLKALYSDLSASHLEAFYDSRVKRSGWPSGSELINLWSASRPEVSPIHERVNIYAAAVRAGQSSHRMIRTFGSLLGR